eukprot:1156677-Pelagomonas_calceolata.AAC.10
MQWLVLLIKFATKLCRAKHERVVTAPSASCGPTVKPVAKVKGNCAVDTCQNQNKESQTTEFLLPELWCGFGGWLAAFFRGLDLSVIVIALSATLIKHSSTRNACAYVARARDASAKQASHVCTTRYFPLP